MLQVPRLRSYFKKLPREHPKRFSPMTSRVPSLAKKLKPPKLELQNRFACLEDEQLEEFIRHPALMFYLPSNRRPWLSWRPCTQVMDRWTLLSIHQIVVLKQPRTREWRKRLEGKLRLVTLPWTQTPQNMTFWELREIKRSMVERPGCSSTLVQPMILSFWTLPRRISWKLNPWKNPSACHSQKWKEQSLPFPLN